MSSYVPALLRKLVMDRSEGLCEYCLIHEQDTFLGCQIEHIISEKHGGLTSEDNLASACVFCNRAKGSDIATLAPRTGNLCKLFNPRSDSWAEHFQLVGTRIEGQTDTGDATVMLLGFNEPDRIMERELLIATAHYPSSTALKIMKKKAKKD